ncbi:MAG: glycoside hydrolase family 2 TIM barrel-domain containing protein [Streptosporangiales bacterium]
MGGAGPRDSISRRKFLATSGAGIAGVAMLSSTGFAFARRGPAQQSLPFSADWLFGGEYAKGAEKRGFDDSGFERVTLPHTVTDLSWRRWDPDSWERTWIYRRHFDRPDAPSGARVFVDFAAAMTGAAVTLNGTRLGEHLGGYLPFGYELTEHVAGGPGTAEWTLRDRDNVLAVTLDSDFDINVPPDRPGQATTTVDFWQPGGIYRQVGLRAVPPTFLADLFAKPVHVLDADRRVDVQCTIDSADVPDGPVHVEVELRDGDTTVARASAPTTLKEPGRRTVDLRLTGLGDIELWHPDTPRLYDVVATLYVGKRALHDYKTRIGFREARFTKNGFFLNGERLKVFGVNRHQVYPFAGHAMPDRVQRRDAEILRRDLNCTMVRCSHYPQSEAFYDACDELGLLAFEEVPGWGLYLGDQKWKDRVVRDVRDMVVRDRNHPSIVIWGARLNECPDDRELFTKTRDLAHELDDSRPTTGAMIGGLYGSQDFVQDVFSFNDYTRRDGHASLRAPRTDLPYLVTEAVGTLSGDYQVYRRTKPAEAQQAQAIAHAWVHETAAADDRYCGLLAWSGYDYESGSGNNYQGVKYTGVVDLFREPKLGAAIYEAQVDPKVRPVIQPAFYWDFGDKSLPFDSGQEAMICSNCDRLELFVDGQRFAKLEPDRARFGHLAYPPFFVDLESVDGSSKPRLRIDGYVGDKRVLSRRFAADPADDTLTVRADDEQLVADGADATRVAFRAVDRYGAPRPYVDGDVTISVDGPGMLVGESPFAFADAGGVGAVWIRTVHRASGTIRVKASHAGLGSGEVTIQVRQAPGDGPPAANADLVLRAKPTLVRRGGTTQVTATLTNRGRSSLRKVAFDLPVPDGWSSQATTPTSVDTVPPGQSVEVTWEVTAPRDAALGSTTLTATATFRAAGRPDARGASTTVTVPTTIERARNNRGISDDSDVDEADFDGVGNSYSAQALAAEGLGRGAKVTHDGLTFHWPDVPTGTPDNIVATGQTVELSGSGRTVGFLGASSQSSSGAGTIHYTDGTASDFDLTLDDYFNPPVTNDVVARMPYLNSQGVGGRPRGRRDHTVYVFYAAVSAREGKEIAGITLPDNGSTGPGRITGIHVFAIATG